MFCRIQNIPPCFSWPLKYTTGLQVVDIIHSLQFQLLSHETSKPGAAFGYLQLPPASCRISSGNFSLFPFMMHKGKKEIAGVFLVLGVCTSIWRSQNQ